MNINLAINEGSKILKSKFIPKPLLDAEILKGKTINKDRNYILLNSNDCSCASTPYTSKSFLL